ncbi:MAG: hypothetical protein U5J78_03380 [Parasphingorhabdus sp.]|nr:hypothetical protein [Parasphingorhabdus sp.]
MEQDRSAARSEALTTARTADDMAITAANGTNLRIEKENDDAQTAADADRDDPLRAGLGELRKSSR